MFGTLILPNLALLQAEVGAGWDGQVGGWAAVPTYLVCYAALHCSACLLDCALHSCISRILILTFTSWPELASEIQDYPS